MILRYRRTVGTLADRAFDLRSHSAEPRRMVGVVGHVGDGMVFGLTRPLGQEDAIAFDFKHCEFAVDQCRRSANRAPPGKMNIGYAATGKLDAQIGEVVGTIGMVAARIRLK